MRIRSYVVNHAARALVAVLLGSTVLAAPASAQSAAPDYADAATWLCRPGRRDVCATADLAATSVAANGTLTRETFAADPRPSIDCFYVYPTVSNDSTPNSDLVAGPEERAVAASQLARFGSVCRTFAPMYRQFTLAALRLALAGQTAGMDRDLGYRDVLAAWRHYLAHDNGGRGVVLVGHSQGSMVLQRLLREEIDGRLDARLLVSAILAGTSVAVPDGKDVGGDFKSIPLCRRAAQTGCVMAWVTFRDTMPPPPNTRFGRVAGAGMLAACTNPAALGGGPAPLHAYLGAAGAGLTSTAGPAWVAPPVAIGTPFVRVPGLLTGECVRGANGTYLALTVHGDPADPRTDTITGDLLANGRPRTEWGLHLLDIPAVMGDLIDVVRQQAKAFAPAVHKDDR